MSDAVIIDASGLSCPQPVLLTKKGLRQAGQGVVQVLVDSATSRDNCTRVAEKEGWVVAAEERALGGFRLVMTK